MKRALCTWAQPTARLGLLGQAAQLPWAFWPTIEEIGEGDCSTAADSGGYQSRQASGGEARGSALGRHGDVVNSIRGNGEEWLTKAVALRWWAVDRRVTAAGAASGGDG
jgi:hypothetical protein